MAMHKGMCGRTESANGPSSSPVNEKTLGDYLVKKYPEEMTKKKMTFDEWWKSQDHTLYRGDSPFEYYVDCAQTAWQAGQQNV